MNRKKISVISSIIQEFVKKYLLLICYFYSISLSMGTQSSVELKYINNKIIQILFPKRNRYYLQFNGLIIKQRYEDKQVCQVHR